jgi:hypothetical protein
LKFTRRIEFCFIFEYRNPILSRGTLICRFSREPTQILVSHKNHFETIFLRVSLVSPETPGPEYPDTISGVSEHIHGVSRYLLTVSKFLWVGSVRIPVSGVSEHLPGVSRHLLRQWLVFGVGV